MVVVAAVDRSERSAVVTREAAAVAKAFDEPVHVVHVLTLSQFVDLGRTSAEEGDAVDMDNVRNVAKTIADEAAGDLDVPFESVGLVGSPAPRVVEYADDNDARYIVVSGRNRSPTGKVLFGSVAQSILLNADCPVISTMPQSG
jgi:nucleotide-binding universal stress UspA family protein